MSESYMCNSSLMKYALMTRGLCAPCGGRYGPHMSADAHCIRDATGSKYIPNTPVKCNADAAETLEMASLSKSRMSSGLASQWWTAAPRMHQNVPHDVS